MNNLQTTTTLDAARLTRLQTVPFSGSGPRRIAMISTHGYVAAQPPLGATDTGGQVVYVLELSKKLAELGYEVDIWTRRFEDQPEVEPVADHVRILRVPCGGRKFIAKERLYECLPEWCENALRYIGQKDLHYGFLNSHYWDAGVAGERLSCALRTPHVHTPHSLGIWKRQQMQTDYPGNAAQFDEQYNFCERIHHERMIYASAKVVVPTTIPQLELLVNEYGVPPEKCTVIPPGFDDSRFFPVSASARRGIRQRLGFERPTVLAVGRLAQNKGYDLLIRAFEVVVKRVPDALLHLAAGGVEAQGDEREIMEELSVLTRELRLENHVHFGSFISDEELADHYRAADVFAMPSRYEPFGMAALEAMACGTPTIVTTHGGFRPAITFGREALYADPLDREEFGIMMVQALHDQRLRGRLSRMGARRAKVSFTWTSVAQSLLAAVEPEAPKVMHAGFPGGSLN